MPEGQLSMGWPEGFTVIAVLVISGFLAGRAPLSARIALWASTLLVSAGMFLPSSKLRSIVGPDLLALLVSKVSVVPWSFDTAAHFVSFLWLGLVLWTLRPDLRGWKAVSALAVLAIAAELMQGLTQERSPHFDDAGINLFGSGIGLMLGAMAAAFRKKAEGPSSSTS